jgi:hypothetical protein
LGRIVDGTLDFVGGHLGYAIAKKSLWGVKAFERVGDRTRGKENGGCWDIKKVFYESKNKLSETKA